MGYKPETVEMLAQLLSRYPIGWQ